ncbi:hypothetical protein AB0M64_09190 [Streptomyces sp. NPDC051771]|uniref:hypothetical protein n=1 Tax=Streptomyces sp. NPDC051771 TaxID=3154847 RepID=UPI00342CD90D
MSVPEVVPIAYEPGHRTSTVGRWDGGQFFASVTIAFPEGWTAVADWRKHQRWYAVLHRFDAAGRYLESRIAFTGTTAQREGEAGEAAAALLDEWLDALPGRRYESIAIAPFTVRFEGVLFGLVVEEGHGEGGRDWAELYPDGLGFSAPWDGRYDT